MSYTNECYVFFVITRARKKFTDGDFGGLDYIDNNKKMLMI